MIDPYAKDPLRSFLGLPELAVGEEVQASVPTYLELPAPAPAPVSARPPTRDVAMDEATSQDNTTSFLSNLGRATATLAGTGQSFWDAQKPSAVTGLRQKRADAASAAKLDPNSPRNQAFRKFVQTEGFAEGLAPEDINLLTVDDWDYIGDTAKMKEAVEARKQAIIAREEEAKLHQTEINDRKDLDRMDRLGKATGSAPFGEIEKALSTLEGIEPGLIYGNRPQKLKLDVIQKALAKDPTRVLSNIMDPEAQRVYTAVLELRDLVARLRTGAVINAEEERLYNDILGNRLFSSPEAMAAGINQIREGIGQKLKNIQIPFNERGLLERFGQQGGTTYLNPLFSTPGAATPAPQATGPKPPSLAPPKLPTATPVQEPAQVTVGGPEVTVEMNGEVLSIPMEDLPLFERNGWRRR